MACESCGNAFLFTVILRRAFPHLAVLNQAGMTQVVCNRAGSKGRSVEFQVVAVSPLSIVWHRECCVTTGELVGQRLGLQTVGNRKSSGGSPGVVTHTFNPISLENPPILRIGVGHLPVPKEPLISIFSGDGWGCYHNFRKRKWKVYWKRIPWLGRPSLGKQEHLF